MPGRYAWLTFTCMLFVLNVSWCRAADEDEHVHIKLRMPELARKHKTHKPSQHHHIHHNYPHQHLYQPLQPQAQPHQHHYHKPQYLSHPQNTYQQPNAVVKHGRRAVRPTAPFPAMMPHNHLDLGLYGDELGGVGLRGGGMSEQLIYSPSAPQSPMATAPDLAPNYGPAVFGNGGAGAGVVAGSGSGSEHTHQHFPPGGSSSSTSVLTMPGSTQQLMQHMELMGALAAAAAAAGGDGDGNEGSATSVAGGGASETNTLLADDFLANMQRTYANGKFPTTNFKRKKKYRSGGLAEIGDAAVTFPLNTPQLQQQHVQQQQEQHQHLLRQQFLQQQQQQQQQQQRPQPFYGANYFMQQRKPQAQMLRVSANNYNSYRQPLHYKNKQHYNYNNNDIYATATTDDGLGGGGGGGDGDVGDGDGEDDEDDIDSDDDVALFFSSRPTFSASSAMSSPSAFSPSTTTAYHSTNDYEDGVDDEDQQFGYKSNSNTKYKSNYFVGGGGTGIDGVDADDANEGVNPVSYQHSTTSYGAFAASASTPATVTHLKLRPYRQLHKHKQPLGFSGHQQYQHPHQQQQHPLITTAQPINVVGPTASDFDEQHPAPPPPPPIDTQHHKYPVSTRYKKRKNRIKGKPNRNRIPTQ